MITCTHCNDEKVTDDNADMSERAPWSFWTSLPPGADLGVRMGLVKPRPCEACQTDQEPTR